MIQYIEVSGKTEEDAIGAALAQLGMERDDVSVEILERAKPGFLGIGGTPATVRVSYDDGKPEPKEEKPAAETKQPVYQPEVLQKKTRPQAKEKEAPQRAERPDRKPEPERTPPADLGEESRDAASEEIRRFLSGLLVHMDAVAQIKVYEVEKNRYKAYLDGEKLGGLIGRRGTTLDAIQQLTNYAVNRSSEHSRVRVQVDAENYRDKRERNLEHLAEKVAAKVVKYRRNVTLEPMNAYERHVIHAALQSNENVSTFSVGTEPNRRVVVAYGKTE